MTARPDIDAIEARAFFAEEHKPATIVALCTYVRHLEAEGEALREQHEFNTTSFFDIEAQRNALRARGERHAVAMRHARKLLDEALADEPALISNGAP